MSDQGWALTRIAIFLASAAFTIWLVHAFVEYVIKSIFAGIQ